MFRKKLKGGSAPTEQPQRITAAMDGNYTPLINAIISGDTNAVIDLLDSGTDPNETNVSYSNERFNWCPLKWLDFVRSYGNLDNEVYEELKDILFSNDARTCYDDYHIREYSYNFSPIILDIDERLEEIRRDAEDIVDSDYEDMILPNRRNMAGGTRKRKARKSKTRKHKKTHKRGTQTSNKRRKHMKK